ncbi:MAG: hypothetical protein H3C27_14815 [Opitutaceae bacterium]|nr:hypothetical protein [Opitutaceae bacterium]
MKKKIVIKKSPKHTYPWMVSYYTKQMLNCRFFRTLSEAKAFKVKLDTDSVSCREPSSL